MSRPLRVPIRHVMAVFVGNGLEFYDFLTFSYFSVYIARTFYPDIDPNTGLLATLISFGVGFVSRPVGAVVIGRMGDRIGRKPAMLLSFGLMGFAILGLALTPSYAVIGYAGAGLVVLFRIVQGFALGGEVGPTTAFMAEAAPPERRGFYLCMQYATQDAASLIAGVIGVVLANVLSDAQLQVWGWRLAMLLGASIVPFGLMLRMSLPETLPSIPAPPPAGPRRSLAHWLSSLPARAKALMAAIRPHLAIVVLGLMMLTSTTIGSYTIGYMTTYALDTLKLAAVFAFGVTIVNGLFSVVSEVASGWLCDRFGRKPVMIAPMILLILSIFPCFWAIDRFHNVYALYGAEFVMVVFAGLCSVPAIVAITEQFPASIRSGAVALVYAFAISIFGGSTQPLIKWMLIVTRNPMAPAYYWTGAALIGLVAMILVKESAPAKRKV